MKREKMKVYVLTKLLFNLFLGFLLDLLLGLDWILGEFFTSCQVLEQAAVGVSGALIPGGTVKT